MTWRLVKSLEKLRSQVNAMAPDRSKGWDGSIGDEAHSSRTSDHNPDPDGTVDAIDITHDPAHGVNSQKIADGIIASRDPRVSYIISNGRICAGRGGPSPWTWRPYHGVNPHDHHVHVSVRDDMQDDARDWHVDGGPVDATVPPAPNYPLLLRGAQGENVKKLQRLLNDRGASPPVEVDGDFGRKTETAVRAFQANHGLAVDGKVGGNTWSRLGATP